MKSVLVTALLVVSLLGQPLVKPASAGQITTSEIVAAATGSSLACMEWRVSGVCFYLVCTLAGCSIETSIQVSHFSPDLVVTSYDELGQSPWIEARLAYGQAQVAANDLQYAVQGIAPTIGPAGGNFAEPQPEHANHKNTIFKDVEVIGGPGSIATIAGSLGLPLVCPMTDVAPGFPYFLSGFDTLAWRSALTELIYPASFIPGLREIGDFPFNSWGSVHPRNGFLISPEDPKAGAVMAQRGADIATRSGQPHVYVPVGTIPGWPDEGTRVWEPGAVRENDPDNSKWQMLVPNRAVSCEAFGENDTLNVLTGWSSGKLDTSRDYAFNLWRPYRCCEEKGIFLSVVEF